MGLSVYARSNFRKFVKVRASLATALHFYQLKKESERRDPCGNRENRGKPQDGSPIGEVAPPRSERPDSCELRKNPSGRVRLRGRAPVRNRAADTPSRKEVPMRLGRTVVLAVALIVGGASAADAIFPTVDPNGLQCNGAQSLVHR